MHDMPEIIQNTQNLMLPGIEAVSMLVSAEIGTNLHWWVKIESKPNYFETKCSANDK